MLVAYGEPAWLIKQPLCQFAPRHTLGSSIRARAQMKVGSLTFHAEQKSHVNDLHMRRARTNSRHSTLMVQRCTGKSISILLRKLIPILSTLMCVDRRDGA
jgi:hypothetical protein